eukprot:GFUD01003642.1.p1 GENE.GFUD01003642.1~~GFUD01003642.1.p1  ORF type:complete len:717 (+),score=243.96 GFUD01003642.1:188-2338(+)
MGAKLSKKGDKKADDEFIINGKSLPENFDNTSTLPASFRRKKHQEVSKFGSLPRNSGTLPRHLDRSSSFSKRFRKSCRNWVAGKGNTAQQKKEKLGDGAEPTGEGAVICEKIEDNPTEVVQDVPEVVVTEPEKEMDLASIVATLVVEAHKKKMASRAQSRAQSREALLDHIEEPHSNDGKSLDEWGQKQSEFIEVETLKTLETPKVNTEVSDFYGEIFDADVCEPETQSVDEVHVESVKEEETLKEELDDEQLIDEVTDSSVDESMTAKNMTHQVITEANEDEKITTEESSVENIIQELDDEGFKAQNTLAGESCIGEVAIEIKDEINVEQNIEDDVSSKEEEKTVPVEELNDENQNEKNSAENTIQQIDDGYATQVTLVGDVSIEGKTLKESLLEEPMVNETKIEETNVHDENELESEPEESWVEENSEDDCLIEEYGVGEPKHDENVLEAILNINEKTNDLQVGNGDQKHMLDENMPKEADDSEDIQQEPAGEKSLVNQNANIECETIDIVHEDPREEIAEQKDDQDIDEFMKNVEGSDIQQEHADEIIIVNQNTNLECETTEIDAFVKEISEQKDDKDRDEFMEDIEVSDTVTADVSAFSEVTGLESNKDSFDPSPDVLQPNNVLESDDAEGIMDQIINDIVDSVTHESRAASIGYGCESPSGSLESVGASSSDEDIVESYGKADDVIEKHVSNRETVSVPNDNECITDKLER